MQFSATEAATKPLHSYFKSEAVPFISAFHPEFKVFRGFGRYLLGSGDSARRDLLAAAQS